MTDKETKIEDFDIGTHPAFAEYREEKAKLEELSRKKRAIDQSVMELQERIRHADRAPYLTGTTSSEESRRVRAILDITDETPMDQTELAAELRVKHEEQRLMNIAFTYQRDRIEKAANAAAKEARATLIPQHKALAQEIVNALKTLRAALLAESDFRDWLDWKRVHFGEPLKWASVPLAFDKCERLNFWLTEFAQDGYKIK